MGPLLPLLLVAALTLPPTLSQSTDRLDSVTVGPGCVNGDLLYPGVPDYASNECKDPVDQDEPETILPTNLDDCSSYFYCHENVAELKCCPAGQLWDPPMRVCDTPPHVDCGTRPILPYPPTTTTPTTTTTTPTTTTTTPTTTTTTTTTTTSTTTTTTSTTPPPSPSSTAPPATTDQPPTTPEPPINSKCSYIPGYIGKLPMEGDCHAYYECDGSETNNGTIHYCGNGDFGQMVYNPTSQACDDQWHYPCDDHIIYPHILKSSSHADEYNSHADESSSHADESSSHADESSSHADEPSSHADGSYWLSWLCWAGYC